MLFLMYFCPYECVGKSWSERQSPRAQAQSRGRIRMDTHGSFIEFYVWLCKLCLASNECKHGPLKCNQVGASEAARAEATIEVSSHSTTPMLPLRVSRTLQCGASKLALPLKMREPFLFQNSARSWRKNKLGGIGRRRPWLFKVRQIQSGLRIPGPDGSISRACISTYRSLVKTFMSGQRDILPS